MKIAFYLDNGNCEGIDFSRPDLGNPGIGGTQYMIWSLSYYLHNKINDLEIMVFAQITETLPKEINYKKCIDIYDAARQAKKLKTDIFVFRGPNSNKDFYYLLDELKLNSIIWAHNYEDIRCLDYASNCKYIKKNICVSRQQYDALRDHTIFEKSTYIYNCLDFSIYNRHVIPPGMKKNVICFMGNLVPNKGFHKVAKLWRELSREIEDLQLYVIGNGLLYNKKNKLGSFNLASAKYEKKFIKYLLNEKNEIDENVFFWGEMGNEEKLKIMSEAKIAIVNPEGKKETFCLVGVEFQALGVPVVSIKNYGIIDTVDNKYELLSFTTKKMAKNIINIMGNNALVESASISCSKYVTTKFNIEKISQEWVNIFTEIMKNEENENIIYETNYYLCDLKWLREFNRRMKNIKLFSWLPSIIWYRSQLGYIRKMIKKN